MVLALISIAVLLIVARSVTLEICALINFLLNYANIIALHVLLGVGVAFKIYYVTAWPPGFHLDRSDTRSPTRLDHELMSGVSDLSRYSAVTDALIL